MKLIARSCSSSLSPLLRTQKIYLPPHTHSRFSTYRVHEEIPLKLEERVASLVSSGGFTPRWLANRLTPEKGPEKKETTRFTIKRSQQNMFMYSEMMTAQGGTKLENSDVDVATTTFECDSKDFFPLFENPTAGEYLYYTAPVTDFHPDVSDALADLPLSLDGETYPPSIWVSSPASATTALHYDVCDNILVQMSGSKRLTMFPPQAFKMAEMYPDAHPRARKSGRVVREGCIDSTRDDCLGAKIPIIDIVLRPGSCVFIPAFHFHQLEVIDDSTSITINNFSTSQAQLLGSQILALFPPIVIDFGRRKNLPAPALNSSERRRARHSRRRSPGRLPQTLDDESIAHAIRLISSELHPRIFRTNDDATRYIIDNLLLSRFRPLSPRDRDSGGSENTDSGSAHDNINCNYDSDPPRLSLCASGCDGLASLFSELVKTLVEEGNNDATGADHISQLVYLHAVEKWIITLAQNDTSRILPVLSRLEKLPLAK